MAETADDSQSLRAFAPALILLAICILINYVDRGNLSIAAPLLKDELGISASQLGILLAAFFWTYTAMQFVSGWLVDRFDVNWVIAAGYLLWSLATATTGFVRGFAILLTMRLMLGIGESVAFPCCSKILARDVPEYHRGFANGVIQSALRCGNVVGTFGSGLLMAMYGWRPVFIGVGLVSLLWLPAWIKWMPCGSATGSSDVKIAGYVDILRQRSFWGASLGHFCAAYLLYFMVTWLPFYLVRERHLSMSSMTMTASVYYLVDAVSAITSGRVSDFWIRKGYTTTLVRKTVMAIGFATAAIAMAACAAKAAHLSTMAHGRWCRLWNGRCRHLCILPNARWSTSGRAMDWPPKWLRQPGRCGRTCSDGIRSGSDRQFCGPYGNHYSSFDCRRNRVGVRSRPSRAGELGGTRRSL